MTNPTTEVLVGGLPAEVLIGLFVGALITVELLRKLATNIEKLKLLVAVKQALAIVLIVLLFATTGAVLVWGYHYVRERVKPAPAPVIRAPEVTPPAAEPATQPAPRCNHRKRRKKQKPPPPAVIAQPLVQKSYPASEAEWNASSPPSKSLPNSGPEGAPPAPEAPAAPELT